MRFGHQSMASGFTSPLQDSCDLSFRVKVECGKADLGRSARPVLPNHPLMNISRITLCLALLLSSVARASNNVLLIIADDFGLDASAVYNTAAGASLAPTPNIASLAANGVKFTNAYSYTVCSPARSSILTGRYGSRTGTANVVGGAASNNALKSSEFTLPDAFAANSGLNYQLKHVGKWHLGGANTAPCQIGGWPSFAGAMIGEIDDYVNWTKVTGSGATASSSTVTTYATTENVNDALAFINAQTAAGKPWFTWVAFNAPHIPYHLPSPTSLCPHYASLSGTAGDIAANPQNYYNAAIEAMDTEIGRLLAGVDLNTTTVIFIGDNGTPQATLQTPYPANRGKATLYEGGIRVPMIIRGPDVVSPGRTSTVLAHVVDLYSTILELAGINVASTVPSGTVLDSQSLVPVLQNQSVTRSRVFGDYWDLAFPTLTDSGRVLRDTQYKLVRLKTGTDRFYDLVADPYESVNLMAAGVGSMTAPQQTAYNSLVTQLAAYNTPPTISTVANQSVAQGVATGALPFTVGDAELSASILSVTVASSNTTLVPVANIVLGGSGVNRTVTATPTAGQVGTSTITLSVTDGIFTTDSSFVLSVGTPTAVSGVSHSPSSPTNTDAVTVTATVVPAGGRTISGVQLAYSTGAGATSTVFSESMGTAAGTWTTANNQGTDNAWTVVNGPNNPYSQTTAANHTAVGAGHPYGLEVNAGPPPPISNAVATVTTTNSINAATIAGAATTSGYVEFYMMVASLGNNMGWQFQTSTDGTTWNTRLSEIAPPAGLSHGYQRYQYDLSTGATGELKSTLKLRFVFAGSGNGATVSKMSVDDIKLIATAPGSFTVAMLDDGAHGDGASGDGVYGATIPGQAAATSVSYTVTATDSSSGTATGSGSYTVGTAAPVLAVTPSTAFSSAGAAGSGTYSPASVTYTISNTGTGTMSWTAGKTQPWLTLSASNGTLAAGAATTVTASINATAANSLSAATYGDTITFSNASTASGNTTRAASLLITNGTPTAPAIPYVPALPAYSSGSTKTVSWPALANATSYTIQIATDAGFASNVVTQTVSSPTASFSNLAHGVTYYYRVLATNSIGSSGYSSYVFSTQDSVAPSVAITSPASGTSTAANTVTVSGTSSDALSAISAVKVNNIAATTSNNFATWTVTVPLAFGTNGITATAYDGAGNLATTAAVLVTDTTWQTYNPLYIPDVITGTTFNLTLSQKSKQFPFLGTTLQNNPTAPMTLGSATTTLGYNGQLMWGPTLIMNQGDVVQLNVTNNVPVDTTTVHWHGFHIPAIMDGGPHQVIPSGTTWSPTFTVKNSAATYWYHPHLHLTTQKQLTLGAGGFIIVRDPQESALALPRTYGVDDIPLAITSRRFVSSNEFGANQYVQSDGTTSTLDNYGDFILVNGTPTNVTINGTGAGATATLYPPQVSLPKQYVRLRILNAEIQRGYNLGFSDNRTFYVIANDQGLVNAPVAVTRMFLMVGERVEILVNLGADTVGASFDLKAYNSGQVFGFPGNEGNPKLPNGASGGENGSLLNNTDFSLLHINVVASTANPVTTLPTTLASNSYWTNTDVTNTRTIAITGGNGGTPGFKFDNIGYTPTLFNHTIPLNAIEKWTVSAGNVFSHALHIHDIKFNIISRSGGTQVSSNGLPAPYESGWKDTVYIPKGETVSVIAKYDDFASNTNPFMFHCHFLNHEDGGMMGQFRVVNNAVEDLAIASFTRYGSENLINLNFKATPGTTYTLQYSVDLGTWTDIGSVTSDGTSANFTETDASRLGQARGFYRVVIPVIP